MGISHNAARERGERVTSFDVTDFPMPHGREEEWRFTPLERLKAVLDDAPSDARLEWTTTLPDGVELTELSAVDARARTVSAPVDRPSALAVAHSGGAVLVRVPAELELAEPIVLRLHGRSRDDVVWGHVLVEVGHHAKATLLVEHTGSAQYAAQISIRVDDGARVDFISVQTWADDAVHVGHTAARLGRDAALRVFEVTLGGETVRLAQTVEYDGPGGDADLLGIYFADAHQHLEHRLFADHAVPRCKSRVTYKGALQGEGAHTVWIGDVLIRAAAEGTDTYEVNRNLVLTDGARADSVPNLEIETGEIIGAGHASATGRFDDEQLFYLQARGIPEDEARRLVVRGFFADLVQRIGIPELEERLIEALERELAVATA
ncbi:MAG: Fe-S cluster assembly protein SufD [Candidatus Nanopelagicales bacterium]